MSEQTLARDDYAQFLLSEARDAQTRFWNALSALEDQLDVALKSTQDLEHATIERLLTDSQMWEQGPV